MLQVRSFFANVENGQQMRQALHVAAVVPAEKRALFLCCDQFNHGRGPARQISLHCMQALLQGLLNAVASIMAAQRIAFCASAVWCAFDKLGACLTSGRWQRIAKARHFTWIRKRTADVRGPLDCLRLCFGRALRPLLLCCKHRP